MEVKIEKKALAKLIADNVSEFTISVKTSGG